MTERKEKHKQKFKERGITLIALVITIIVLLILAGVGLSVLTGDSGIINNAENAKDKTNLANAKEQVALAAQGARLKNVSETGQMTITYANLTNELNNIIGTGKYEIEPKEDVDLWTVTVGEYEAIIKKDGSIIKPLPSASGTKPWLPAGFSQVEGTDLSNGLTITNENGLQNYVWIEVPTTIEEEIIVEVDGKNETKIVKLSNAADETEIAAILEAYVGDYSKGAYNQNRTSWKDEWYDFYNATWNGTSEYAYIANGKSTKFSKWKTYYGENNVYYSDSSSVTGIMTKVNFVSDSYSSSNYYFVKVDDNFKNHSDGCGLTYNQYQIAYSNMLNSIKKYGGFWLAQYEAGIAYEEDEEDATNRKSHDKITISKANYTKDQYPYNFVYCDEAQKIANADSTDKYTSSLPFGIQWDLVCKFLEVKKAKSYDEIAKNSNWGNYSNTQWISSTNSRYYSEETEGKFNSGRKEKSSGIYLLTTGAIDEIIVDSKKYKANPMNIYDLAGNVQEYTLEHCNEGTAPDLPYAIRGGMCNYASNISIAFRNNGRVESHNYATSFRSTLY